MPTEKNDSTGMACTASICGVSWAPILKQALVLTLAHFNSMRTRDHCHLKRLQSSFQNARRAQRRLSVTSQETQWVTVQWFTPCSFFLFSHCKVRYFCMHAYSSSSSSSPALSSSTGTSSCAQQNTARIVIVSIKNRKAGGSGKPSAKQTECKANSMQSKQYAKRTECKVDSDNHSLTSSSTGTSNSGASSSESKLRALHHSNKQSARTMETQHKHCEGGDVLLHQVEHATAELSRVLHLEARVQQCCVVQQPRRVLIGLSLRTDAQMSLFARVSKHTGAPWGRTQPEYDIASLFMLSFYCFVTKACARRPGTAASVEHTRRERHTLLAGAAG